MAEWLGWWTLTEARQRLDELLDERRRIGIELRKMPAEFKREFEGQMASLPAYLVMGSINTGGAQVRWRQRGRNGKGQSFVLLGGRMAAKMIAAVPEDLRGRLLDYERRGYWLNAAVAVRDREIKVIGHYLDILERQRRRKAGESE
ncbi:MAG: hypothetical protein ACOY5H_07605 [Pseudomonadota bacterium]|jgi:hypothetical protein